MLKVPSLVGYVPNLLDQFVDDNGLDLSVMDDCLCSQPTASRCIFGHKSFIYHRPSETSTSPQFTANQWTREHPLHLLSECEYGSVYDHPLVIAAVDSKTELFGNLLYLFILLIQSLYVILYTGVTLVTRTPKFYGHNYVDFENSTCVAMCHELTNSTDHFDYATDGTFILYLFRFILFLFSCFALAKEFIQIVTQRGRYFRAFFLNLLEILTYSCAIIFALGKQKQSPPASVL
jgi:hypothetical protein